MNESLHPKACPRCGKPIPRGAPEGLCPACLLEEVVAPATSGAEAGQGPNPPPLEALREAFPALEIIELIGQGGMGFVFKARQLKLNRLVALKILSEAMARDPAFAERFAREGQLLARLSHPNVVTVHDFGRAGGYFYLLMEYVDGVNLREAMRANRFTPAQALDIVPGICAALQYAHEEGVLHRDIKPENILLDTKGRLKIADFGIAKLMRESERKPEGAKEKPGLKDELTQPGAAPGTPRYMAPEQIETPSDVDHRADIYSLGVVFYELLTGELPSGSFVPPSRKTPMDPRVDEVVARALEKQRERRFQSAGEIRTRVEVISQTAAAVGKPPESDLPAAAAGHPISLSGPVSTTLLVGLIALISLMLHQTVPWLRFVLRYTWQTTQQGQIQGAATVAGVAVIGWLGVRIWRRREWLMAPIWRATAPAARTQEVWLSMAWTGFVLCLALQVLFILLGQLAMLVEAAATAVRPGFPWSYAPGVPGAGFLNLYLLFGAALPILLFVFLVRREWRRTDLMPPAPPPAWIPRAMLYYILFSLVVSMPAPRDPGMIMINKGGLVAVAALALFTFSRLWRGIALALLLYLLNIGVLVLLRVLIVESGGQRPIQWIQKVGAYDLWTWNIILQLVNLVCLSAALGVLLLPGVRAAFGLRPGFVRGRAMPSPQISNATPGAPHES